MNLSWQRAQLSEMEMLLGMMAEFYALEEIAFERDQSRRAIARLLGDDSLGRVWTIRSDETIVGYVVLVFGYSLEYRGRDAFLDEVYLKPEARGAGLGRRTLEFLEGECRRLEIKALHLEVNFHNPVAEGLYRRFGFVEHQRRLMTRLIG